jgi:hypothetical protein
MSAGVIRIGVEAVALRGPGLLDWATSRTVLIGDAAYRAAPIELDAPAQLSAAERRRAVPSVKLALGVAAACVAQAGRDHVGFDQAALPARRDQVGLPAGRDPGLDQAGCDQVGLPAVFASSGADGETIAAILAALVTPGREVSPTRFHNSVHNAPSGYWGIATRSREAVTSVSCFDATFGAGLLEAGVEAVTSGRKVLLVAYDLPYPEPLNRLRPIDRAFGVALLLTPPRGASGGAPASVSGRVLAELRVAISAAGEPSRCADPGLEALRRGNPAARSLPLLVRLACGSAGRIRLDLSRGLLDVEVVSCGASGERADQC